MDVCDKCDKIISLEEADVSYAYTDKAYTLCEKCFQQYKQEEASQNIPAPFAITKLHEDLQKIIFTLVL